jgi:hypothetical protein
MRRTAVVIVGAVSALAVATAGSAGVQALITGAQIKDGTIESRDIENGTIRRADIGRGAIASLEGDRGPRGAQGPSGPAGAQGPAGAPGPQGASGPQGATGAQGPQGPQGAKGDTGDGLKVDGSVATAGDLPAGAAVGDAYIVLATGHLHVWDGAAWIDAGEVRGPAGPAGPTGATGPSGPQGVAGPTGPAGADGDDGGLAGYEIVTGAAQSILEADFVVSASAACPAGKVALGGGVNVADPTEGVFVTSSQPTLAGTTHGWSVTLVNVGADNTLTPYAVCASSV